MCNTLKSAGIEQSKEICKFCRRRTRTISKKIGEDFIAYIKELRDSFVQDVGRHAKDYDKKTQDAICRMLDLIEEHVKATLVHGDCLDIYNLYCESALEMIPIFDNGCHLPWKYKAVPLEEILEIARRVEASASAETNSESRENS